METLNFENVFNISDSYFISDDNSSLGILLNKFIQQYSYEFLDERTKKSLDQLANYLDYLQVRDESYISLNQSTSFHPIPINKHRRRALILTETQKGKTPIFFNS